jgi:pilus assembly protein CpaB
VNVRRRRGLLLLCVALASGGLAASQVHERERSAAARLGPDVEVLVATREIPAGAPIARAAVGVRRVPARYAPPDALASAEAEAVVGARSAAGVAAGGYLTATLLRGGDQGDAGGLRRGERAVTVRVAAGGAAADLQAGTSVDVLVSTETGAAGGRTTMALAGAELLGVEAGTGSAYDGPESTDTASAAAPAALATLRVSVDQAIYLTAADNFAREVRLLPRPPGDHTRAGRSVTQGAL